LTKKDAKPCLIC
jgi:hypothetical protein